MNRKIIVFIICIAIVEAHGSYRDAFLKHKNLKMADDTHVPRNKPKAYGVLQNLIEQIIKKEIEAEQRMLLQQAALKEEYPASESDEKNRKSKPDGEFDFLSDLHFSRFG